MAALLSGEMKDTVEVNPAAAFLLEKMFSRKERADLFRSWAGSASMWLKVNILLPSLLMFDVDFFLTV